MSMRIFISSVQKEFARERAALRDYLRGDALLRRFFEAFLFEEVPAAARQADELYLTRDIERMGTGTGDMIRRCREAGLPEPQFAVSDGFVITVRRQAGQVAGQVTPPVTGQVTGQVAGWVVVALRHCVGSPKSSREIQTVTGFRHRETFQRNYLDQLLAQDLVERTIPDKPNSRLQKYRLTAKGTALLATIPEDKPMS